MFYTAYFKQGVPTRRPADHLPVQRRPRLIDRVAAHGRVRPGPCRHRRRSPHPRALSASSTTTRACSTRPTSCSSTRPAPAFRRIAGKDKEKAFYGVDQDIDAFAQFITQFLSKYGRWNSPKYVFGESYGTMRGAGLALALQNKDVDLNGVILLSDILNWDFMPDDPQVNPASTCPTSSRCRPMRRRPGTTQGRQPAGRPRAFLAQVEAFATGEYAPALIKGNDLPAPSGSGSPSGCRPTPASPSPTSSSPISASNMARSRRSCSADQAVTTGTLDTRFVGATLDPLSKVASYDPQSAAISAAYLAAWNSYVRDAALSAGIEFKSGIPIYSKWDYKHAPPGADKPLIALPNVLPDLAVAMKQNPDMKVMVNGGYYDVSTPYFEGKMEMRHLPVPPPPGQYRISLL